jgi:hypothetical protein
MEVSRSLLRSFAQLIQDWAVSLLESPRSAVGGPARAAVREKGLTLAGMRKRPEEHPSRPVKRAPGARDPAVLLPMGQLRSVPRRQPGSFAPLGPESR